MGTINAPRYGLAKNFFLAKNLKRAALQPQLLHKDAFLRWGVGFGLLQATQ
jgi:hypothetical protein